MATRDPRKGEPRPAKRAKKDDSDSKVVTAEDLRRLHSSFCQVIGQIGKVADGVEDLPGGRMTLPAAKSQKWAMKHLATFVGSAVGQLSRLQMAQSLAAAANLGVPTTGATEVSP